MDKRFKPLLAAAVAAGVIPVLDPASSAQAALTAAGFTFESLASTGTTPGSISIAADVFSPGYGGNLVASLGQSTSGGFFSPTGNGSLRALSANNWASGGQYTFSFNIDDLQSLVIAFDSRGSNTGPRDYLVQTSLDGVTFTPLTGTSYAVSNVGWASSTSITSTFYQFSLPAGFSDTNPGFAGELGYVRLLQTGTANITGGTVSTSGTNSIDNVFITGDAIPEPATAAIMTLAAAALSFRRRRQD